MATAAARGTCVRHGYGGSWCDRCRRVICRECGDRYKDVSSDCEDPDCVHRLCPSCQQKLLRFLGGESLEGAAPKRRKR